MAYAGSLGYGFLEAKAKADAGFILNKVPKPITQLGFAGNIALLGHLANKFLVRNRYLQLLVDGAAHATAYQIGRMGGTFSSTTISGIGEDDGNYLGLDEREVGALADGYDGDEVGDDGDDIGGEDVGAIEPLGLED